MTAFMQQWQQRLAQRREQHLYRTRQVLQSPQATHIQLRSATHTKQPLINFCSNDYLALANHPQLIAAAQRALHQYGLGSGASHLVCGHHRQHQLLEEELAVFTGRARALLFSSGYMANLGVLSALLGKGDAVFEDKLNHASLLDGGLLSGARFQRFLHGDIQHLETRLARSTADFKLIVVDAVFSMDGDLADLSSLSALAERYQACLMVDDAHGFGYLGANGAGSAEHFALNEQQLPIYMATLGKALGCCGAFVAGSEALIENLIQFSRSYIYTTALPPAMAAAARVALRLLKEEAWRRVALHHNIQYFREQAAEQKIALSASTTAIQPVLIGDSATALRISARLQEQGFFVAAIRQPTVAQGSARLRITLSATHQRQQIADLLALLKKYLQVEGCFNADATHTVSDA